MLWLQDAGRELPAWALAGGRNPSGICARGLAWVWLMCGKEGRVMSPSFPRIALARAGNHGEVPACGTRLHPEVLNTLGDAQIS